MIWSVLSGRRRGTPPVARSNFWYRYTVPRSSVTLRPRGSSAVIRRPRCSAAPVAAVFRQIFSSGSPFQRAFESGGPNSEEHASELQPHSELVCSLQLEKKKNRSHVPVVPPADSTYLELLNY